MTVFYVFRKDGDLEIDVWSRDGKPFLECGHVANSQRTMPHNPDDPVQVEASDEFGNIRVHSCVIHDCLISVDPPDLTGRQAKCVYCGSVKESSMSLPFFQVHPDRDFDEFYSGCKGWN